MSYRPTVEYQPRNALAEYAQVQNILGAQTQQETAQLQQEALRAQILKAQRDEKALDAWIENVTRNGGPEDPMEAATQMIKTRNPHLMEAGTKIQQTIFSMQRDRAAVGLPPLPYGRATVTAPSTGAAAAPAATPAAAPPPLGELVAAPIPAPTGTFQNISPEGVASAPQPLARGGANALAPAAAVAPAVAPVNQLAAAAAAPTPATAPVMSPEETRAREMMLSSNPGVRKIGELEYARLKPALPETVRTMTALGIPITEAGFVKFEQLKQNPGEFMRLLAASGLPQDAQSVLIRRRLEKEATHPQGVTVTNVMEKAEAGEYGKLMVKQFEDLSKAAGLAVKTLPGIEANLSALNKGFDTGFGTDAKAAAARVLGALGVANADKFATDAQTFQSNALNALLQKQLEQKGVQTDQDARRIEQIGAQLGKTKDANTFILDVAKEQLKRDIEQRNFYADWRAKSKNKSFEGAEDAWFAGEGGKSLFDRPALKKYRVGGATAEQIPTGAPTAPAAPAASSVRSQADAILRGGK